MIIQDWLTSEPELIIGRGLVERIDHSIYIGRLINPDILVSDGISIIDVFKALPLYFRTTE